jgi:hypothetical protein
MTCNSPKQLKEIIFHTDDIKNNSNPYLTIIINEANVKLFESEGWICLNPDGTTTPLMIKE